VTKILTRRARLNLSGLLLAGAAGGVLALAGVGV
jgi:hypothetical protein